ncbi:hypothetical protein L9F63_009095, partial [Diploptera punctata]
LVVNCWLWPHHELPHKLCFLSSLASGRRLRVSILMSLGFGEIILAFLTWLSLHNWKNVVEVTIEKLKVCRKVIRWGNNLYRSLMVNIFVSFEWLTYSTNTWPIINICNLWIPP